MFFFAFNDDYTVSLISKAKRGDEGAFCALINEIEPAVFNLALRMMNGNRADAEDMAQEAFLRVYKALPSFKGNASIKTWSLRICKNVCLDEIRKRGSRITADEEIPEFFAAKSSVEGDILAAERKRVLEAAINSLDERAKALITLRDINSLPYKGIAEIMGLEEGTVKSALNRARKKLRSIIEEQNII